MSEVVNAIMSIERVTKRKYRFYESDEDGNPLAYKDQSVGTLYLPHALFDGKPERIKVRVEVEPLE